MFQLSRVMADIWSCLHENTTPNDRSIESVSEDLESWYHQAQRVRKKSSKARPLIANMPCRFLMLLRLRRNLYLTLKVLLQLIWTYAV